VGELDEDTLDERHDRLVTPIVGDVELKVGPWRCRCVGFGWSGVDTTDWVALSFRMYVLLRGSSTTLLP